VAFLWSLQWLVRDKKITELKAYKWTIVSPCRAEVAAEGHVVARRVRRAVAIRVDPFESRL
jgi:hypothetical protein